MLATDLITAVHPFVSLDVSRLARVLARESRLGLTDTPLSDFTRCCRRVLLCLIFLRRLLSASAIDYLPTWVDISPNGVVIVERAAKPS